MALPNIHVIYRFWFLWLEPALCIVTAIAFVFMPKEMLDALVPPPLPFYLILEWRERYLTYKLAIFYAFQAIITGGVLRISKELRVWRAVVMAVLFVDIAMLASDFANLDQEPGRLSVRDMHSTGWSIHPYSVLVTAVKVSFLAGVGVQDVKSKKWDLG